MMAMSAAGLVSRKQQIEDFATQITDPWLWFQLNRQEGATVDKFNNHSGQLITTEQTLLSGSSVGAAIWSGNPGWCDPAGTAYWSNYSATETPNADGITAMFDWSTLAANDGGFLMLADLYIPTSAAGGDDIYGASCGSTQATYGEHRMYVNAQQVLLGIKNKGGSTTLQPATQSGLSAGRHQVAFFVNASDMTCTVYVDGGPATGGAATVDLSTDGTGLPAMEHRRGVRVLARPNGLSGQVLGTFGTNDAARMVRNVIFRRFNRNVAADIPELIADVYGAGTHLLPASWGQI